ncbi:hypothetical protein CKF54_04195 [Psittacicella hinzii]|uniref:endopeptidase La n=1 Tax=Psittacicella hinzii TaxID=2028575 RepID=A0A3A1Y3K1_9GAMM|nr:S16 family serine protease [Psittacicella hinzii]RIY32813.1 hypothetical protein CKF54_04195 [Psittacicella hinzii]
MLKRLTPAELDLELILANYARNLSSQDLITLDKLVELPLQSNLNNFIAQYFTLQFNESAKSHQQLDVDINLNEPAKFTPQALKEFFLKKENTPLSEDDYSYIRSYLLYQWLLFDDLEVKLADLISAKASILAVEQSRSLHSAQSQLFQAFLAEVNRSIKPEISISNEEVWQIKANFAYQQINGLLKDKSKNAGTSTSALAQDQELKETNPAINALSYKLITDLNRAEIFGCYNHENKENPFTLGYLNYPNTILAITAEKMAEDPELVIELINAITNQQYNLHQVTGIDKFKHLPSLTLASNCKLIILANAQEREEVNSYLEMYDKYSILGAYSYHATDTEFMLNSAKIYRDAYLLGFGEAIERNLTEEEIEKLVQKYLRDPDNKDTYNLVNDIHLQANLKTEFYEDLPYQTQLVYAPEHLEQGKEDSDENSLEYSFNYTYNLKLLDYKFEYFTILCRLVMLKQLLGFPGKIDTSYLNKILVTLFDLNETKNRLYWATDRINYIFTRAGNSENKFIHLKASEARQNNKDYQAFLHYVLDDYQHIETSGIRIGTANGLAYIDENQYSHDPRGVVFRLSCILPGESGSFVDVDAELNLAGKFARRANIISYSYIKSLFTDGIDFSANLLTEQLYEKTDGDSASVCSFITIASAISKCYVRQDLAVTGNMDQFGNILAVGGVSQKIEAFYDLCKARTLTGLQGVIIPEVNVKNLVLRDDIMEEVAKGRFKIFSASHVYEVFELMTEVAFADPSDNTTLNQEKNWQYDSVIAIKDRHNTFISRVLYQLTGQKKKVPLSPWKKFLIPWWYRKLKGM